MRKFFLTLAVLVSSASLLMGQSSKNSSRRDEPRKLYVALQGGAMYSVSENYFTYAENGKALGLVTPFGALSVGYDFSHRFGIRGSLGYGKNAGAANTRQTAARGFYPFTFSDVNLFADAILNLGSYGALFQPKLYVGLGGGYSFGFTESGHPWQKVTPKNLAFGFRGGFLGEFVVSEHVGILIDLRGEGFTDNFSGIQPSAEDQAAVEGYAGFPLDLRAMISLGVAYRF